MRYPYDLAVCAILRNEGNYVEEWLKWHILAGVSKFFLYDNESDDDTAAILRPYVRQGIVEYVYYPGKCRQIPAYNDCIRKHRYDAEWIAFIDGDEFLQPLGEATVLEILHGMREQHADMGGLAVTWRNFGSNGHVTAPAEGGVIANYVRRECDHPEQHIKTIVNPRCVRAFFSSHYPVYYAGFSSLDEQGEPVPVHLSSSRQSELKQICLVHYSMKSWEEWLKRRSQGKADAPSSYDVSQENFDALNAKLNEVYDDSMLRMKTELLERCGGVMQIPKAFSYSGAELEEQLRRLLKGFEALDLRELFSVCHAYGRLREASMGKFSSSAGQELIFSLLHLYLSGTDAIRVGDYDFLSDALRGMPTGYPGLELLRQDLERLRPKVEKWKLAHSHDPYALYIERLIRSREPDYLPRVAVVTPSLRDEPEVRYLVEAVRVLHASEMQLVVYAAEGGALLHDFSEMGIPVILDEKLLSKTFNELSWHGGYDLIWLNTSCCSRLLMEHTAPVGRPVLWWLHEDAADSSAMRELRERAQALKNCWLVATMASTQGLKDVWGNVHESWVISGVLQPPEGARDAAFIKSVRSVTEELIRLGIRNRMPFEEGIR